jgi:hypothetical protein
MDRWTESTRQAHGLQNSKMISVIESVMKGSDFMKEKEYTPNLGRMRVDGWL